MPGQRILYQEGQVLSADLLNGEQQYLESLRRRHNAAAHGWGIARGLSLAQAPDGGLVVRPGIAYDLYGRELVLSRPVSLPYRALRNYRGKGETGPVYLTFWLCYRLTATDPDETNAERALQGERTESSCPPARLLEIPAVRIRSASPAAVAALTEKPSTAITSADQASPCLWPFLTAFGYIPKADADALDPRRPPDTNPAARAFTPAGDPPVDALEDQGSGQVCAPGGADCWPVFLGLAVSAGEGQPFKAALAPADQEGIHRRFTDGIRPVGEVIRSASTFQPPDDPNNPAPQPLSPVPRAEVILGGVSVGQRHHFAVRLPDAKGQPVERLSIDEPGDTAVRGSMTVGCGKTFPDLNFVTGLKVVDLVEAAEELPENLTTPAPVSRSETPPLHRERGAEAEIGLPEAIELPGAVRPPVFPGQLQLNPVLFGKLGEGVVRRLASDVPEIRDRLDAAKSLRLLDLLTGPLMIEPQNLAGYRLRQSTFALASQNPSRQNLLRANWQIAQDLDACPDVPDLPGAVAFGLRFQTPKAPPKTAAPWRIYLVEFQDPNGVTHRQLRIEIAGVEEGADPDVSQFVIGKRLPQTHKLFNPCVTVNAGCSVRIEGTLRVGGQIVQSPVGADPNDKRFLQSMIDAARRAALVAELAYNTATAKLNLITITKAGAIPFLFHTHYEIEVENTGIDTLGPFTIADNHIVDGTTTPPAPKAFYFDQRLKPGEKTVLAVDYNEFRTSGTVLDYSITVISTRQGGPAAYADVRTQATVP